MASAQLAGLHPDAGGETDAMRRFNDAVTQLRREG